ncbi:hypothetical protein KR044_005868, partial [Drosophila immigrans]
NILIVKCDDNTTKTPGGIAHWKFRGVRYTTSENYLCWKENWELFLRQCNIKTGQWLPKIVTCQIPEKSNQFCPEDLVELHNDYDNDHLCLKISSTPHKYDDEFCYGSNAIAPSDLSKDQLSNLLLLLLERNIIEYWLPFRRDNNTMPFNIRLPGKHWRQVVDSDKIEKSSYNFNRDCMSAQYFQSFPKKKFAKPKMMMKDCQALLHSICIFQDNFVTASGCPKGFGALRYRPNECYGVHRSKSAENTQILLKEYFQNRNILRRVLKYSIAENSIDQFFEVGDFLADSGESYVILMDRNERVYVKNRLSGTLPILNRKVVNVGNNAVQLILKIDFKQKHLILIVYNPKYLWRIGNNSGIKCFTNADYDILQDTNINLIWENESKTKSIYKVKLVGKYPGEYWCEGHTIQHFQLVSSLKIVTSKETNGHTFSVKLNMTCTSHSEFNLCNNIKHIKVKRIAKHDHEVLRKLAKTISPQLVIHNTRIMSIDIITSNYTIYWIHITVSLMNSTVNNSDEGSSEERDNIENEQSIRHDAHVRMEVWNLLQKLIYIYNFNSNTIVRSTEYCFPEMFNTGNDEIFQWNQAVRGEVGTLSSLCLQNNGMPLMRKCQGNFIYGAYWEELKENILCHLKNEEFEITKALYSLDKSKVIKRFPEKTVREVRTTLQEYEKSLLPADIYYTANILQSSIKYIQKYLNSNVSGQSRHRVAIKYATHDLVEIYNYIINVKQSTIKMSAALNSTNKLLEAMETAINILSVQKSENISNETSDEIDDLTMELDILDYVDIGVTVKVSSNFLYFIINPIIANVSGIALFHNHNLSELPNILKGAFKHEHFRFLQSSHDIQELISEPNLQFATYLPEKLLDNMNTISNTINVTEKPPKIIVIKIYSNDKLFQPRDNLDQQAAMGRVVSISLPGYNTQLPENLPIVLRIKNKILRKNSGTAIDPCRYWNFENWVADGICLDLSSQITNQDIVICQVSHLTPFSYLVGFNITNVNEDLEDSTQQVHHQALDIITVIGCSLSLLGICGIFITAV